MSNILIDDSPLLTEIATRLHSDQAALLVGSGFSKNAAPRIDVTSPFPDWSELGEILYHRLHPTASADPRFLSIPEIASELQASIGRPGLNQMLIDAIRDDHFDHSPLHKQILDLPWSDVFTTNYDTLLDRAASQVSHRPYSIIHRPSQLVYSNSPRLIKLHGCISDPSWCVVTDEDYRLYPQEFAPFVNTVCQSLIENTLCLIGFSARDPNFVNWINWSTQSLGSKHTPKIYLVTLSGLSNTQQNLLNQRRISLVDISTHGTSEDTPYTRIEAFLEYLDQHGRAETAVAPQAHQSSSTPTRWPTVDTSLLEPARNLDKRAQLSDIAESWARQRSSYPGWVIVPEDGRRKLWRYTHRWINFIEENHDAQDAVTLDLFFELAWRMEKCLCPLFDNQASTIASFIDTHFVPSSGQWARNGHIQSTRHYLLLALMRYYREEGDSDSWQKRRDQLRQEFGQLSAQHKADLYYEMALNALFDMDLPDLQSVLATWPTDEEPPFNAARRAGLQAETGGVCDALSTASESLRRIRSLIKERPDTDYALLSQESYVMVLLRYLQRADAFRQGQFALDRETEACFSDRWNVLKQHLCDPWNDLGVLERSLEKDYVKPSRTVERTTFDIGVITRSVAFGGIDSAEQEALIGYQLLRLFEDSGLPYRIPGSSLATKAAGGAAIRISDYSLHWAITTAARVADEKTIDRLFARARIATWSRAFNDNLIRRYLAWDKRNSPGVMDRSRLYDTNVAVTFARVMPEILSRLCCKCSSDSKHELLRFLHHAYSFGNVTPYRSIGKLAERLLNSFSVTERLAIVSQLIEFIVPDNLILPLAHEMRNPLIYLRIPEAHRNPNLASIDSAKVTALIHTASEGTSDTKEWALRSLMVLYTIGLLNDHQSRSFADVLWTETDETGFPCRLEQNRFLFLEMPSPPTIDLVLLFKRYVASATFPEQRVKAGVSLHTTWEIGLVADIVGAGRRIQWSESEVNSILSRVVSWWDSDKRHLRVGDETEPFGSIALEFHLRFRGMIKSLVAILHSGVHLQKPQKSALQRLIFEMRSNGLPTLEAEVATLHIFRDSTEDVVGRLRDAMRSDTEPSVVDSMEAVLELLERPDRDAYVGLLSTATFVLGQMICWVSTPIVRHAISVATHIAERYPYVFEGEFERDTLNGLRRIIEYTTAATEGLSLSEKLVIREAAAGLAYGLRGLYAGRGGEIPDEIRSWERICRSEEEFDEIRNQWIDY